MKEGQPTFRASLPSSSGAESPSTTSVSNQGRFDDVQIIFFVRRRNLWMSTVRWTAITRLGRVPGARRWRGWTRRVPLVSHELRMHERAKAVAVFIEGCNCVVVVATLLRKHIDNDADHACFEGSCLLVNQHSHSLAVGERLGCRSVRRLLICHVA